MLIELSLKFVQGFNWQHVIIGSSDGLAPNRPQAITWTHDGPIQGRIFANDVLPQADSAVHHLLTGNQLLFLDHGKALWEGHAHSHVCGAGDSAGKHVNSFYPM